MHLLRSCPKAARKTNLSGVFTSSYSAQNDEHKHDEENGAQKPRGAVTPAGAVRPTWEGADEHEDKKDKKNCSK
jgi:hypothetical protein